MYVREIVPDPPNSVLAFKLSPFNTIFKKNVVQLKGCFMNINKQTRVRVKKKYKLKESLRAAALLKVL